MDKMILGILMVQRLTAYEIRNIIRDNFRLMCSDSLGSIQAALKKLVADGRVTCSEHVEKGINKKRYSITDSGRTYFMEWLRIPAEMAKIKNMDLAKLLFMGMIPSEERKLLLDEIISKLELELKGLEEIWSSIKREQSNQETVQRIERDPEYRAGIEWATQNGDLNENVREICDYELITLEYGINITRFQADWFKTLRSRIVGEEEERGDCR